MLIVDFSGRDHGNCDQIAHYIKKEEDCIIQARKMNIHPCSNCEYECFKQPCRYRQDEIYHFYQRVNQENQVVYLIPMYSGLPSSLFSIINERSQDYYVHNEPNTHTKYYYILIYGSKEGYPYYEQMFQKITEDTNCTIYTLERWKYDQKIKDLLLDHIEAKQEIDLIVEQIRKENKK